jgi:flagellar basal body-associated protein FliL
MTLKTYAQDLNSKPNTKTQSSQNNQQNTSRSVSTVLDRNNSTQTENQGGLTSIFILLFGLFGFIAIILVGLVFFRKKLWEWKRTRDWKNSIFLELSVPKETAEEVQKQRAGSDGQADKSMIGMGEAVLSVLSEYSESDWKKWLFGAPRFSFEIVNIDQTIKFWIVCDEEMASVVERQVVAIYNKAFVKRLDKTNFFKENTIAYSQELVLGHRYEVPFKTYMLTDGDPLNALTNSMGGLLATESAAVQLIVTPIKEKWQDNARLLATKVQQGQNPMDLLFPDPPSFLNILVKVIGGVFSVLGNAFSKKKEEDKIQSKSKRKIDLSGQYESIQLTEQQREITKKLEEKASKSGFVFTLRVVAAAQTEARSKQIVNSILPAFQIYDIKPFNWFTKTKTNTKTSILNFLLRSPNLSPFFINGDRFDIINTEEICSVWHLPNYLVTTPNIKWLLGRKPAIPLEVAGPGEGNVHIGTSSSRGQTKEIFMQKEDRFRHVYSLGGSGSGKSVLMTHIILQDIENGDGLCVVDPHGELVDDILLRIPEDRIKDVILFSPAIIDRPLGLNMLEFDPKKPSEKTLVIDTLFTIWDKLYDLKKTGGPMFESYMKNSMRLVMSHPESGSTLMEISKILSDEDFRSFKLAMCDEQEVVDFWEKEATKAGGEASLENMIPYITSKLAPFVTNDFIKPMVGQQKSAINFRQAMDNKKIILVKLEKGLIGETSAYLVGMVIVGNLLMAGMGRNDGLRYNEDGTTVEILASERVPFFVYIDEMQNFLFDAIPKALEEIRKYKVGFYLAHQFVKQVIVQGDERIKDSIMANCASKFIFRCSADDATYLEKEFNPLSIQDIANPERYTYNTILLANGQRTTPFNINAPAPRGGIDPEKRKRVIEMTKQKYGKPREEIEQEIKDRAKLLF